MVLHPRSSEGPGRGSATPRAVLFVVDEIVTPSAGTEGQLLQLIGGLAGSSIEPHLAVLRNSDFVASGAVPCPVHVLDLRKLAALTSVSKLLSLARLISTLSAHVAHVFFNDASIVAPPFSRLAGARTVVSRRDMGFWYTPSVLRALRLANRFVDVIVANSDAVKQNVSVKERFPLNRIEVIGNGHRPERFTALPDPDLRRRLGIKPSDPVVGMVANLYQRKRQADLVKAFARVRETHREAHLILVGRGPDSADLQTLASTLHLNSAFHVLEGVAEPVSIVKHFDVAVLCSESEGFSNSILEYAFCERPIVCTNVGGNVEIVEHEQSGLLVGVGDVEALAAAIAGVLHDPALGRALGQRAYHLARTRYSADAMVSAYAALYDRLSSGPTAAAARHDGLRSRAS